MFPDPVMVSVDRREDCGGNPLWVSPVRGIDPLQRREVVGWAACRRDDDWDEAFAQFEGAVVLPSALAGLEPAGAQAGHHGGGRLDGGTKLGTPWGSGRNVVLVDPELPSAGPHGLDDGHDYMRVLVRVRH